MNKVEKIKAEIERLKQQFMSQADNFHSLGMEEKENHCAILASHMAALIRYIDSLEEEPVSNDLEKAAIEAFKRIVDSDKNSFYEIFKAGAQWDKEQTEIQIKAQSIALPHGCPLNSQCADEDNTSLCEEYGLQDYMHITKEIEL